MRDKVPPLWFDIVSDLTAHLVMAEEENPEHRAAMIALLTQAIEGILHLQSEADIARAEEWTSEGAVAEALLRERSRRNPITTRLEMPRNRQ